MTIWTIHLLFLTSTLTYVSATYDHSASNPHVPGMHGLDVVPVNELQPVRHFQATTQKVTSLFDLITLPTPPFLSSDDTEQGLEKVTTDEEEEFDFEYEDLTPEYAEVNTGVTASDGDVWLGNEYTTPDTNELDARQEKLENTASIVYFSVSLAFVMTALLLMFF